MTSLKGIKLSFAPTGAAHFSYLLEREGKRPEVFGTPRTACNGILSPEFSGQALDCCFDGIAWTAFPAKALELMVAGYKAEYGG